MTTSSANTPIITVQQHILQEQKRFPGASGEFSWLLSGITMHETDSGQSATSRTVRNLGRARSGKCSRRGSQKLDVYAFFNVIPET